DDQMIDELSRTIQALNLPNVMRVKEFLNIPEEDITYEIFEDEQIITELINIFKNSYENTEDLDEIDDSDEIVTISTNIALKSLETVNMFLLQQENTEEYIKLIGKIEKFIRKKQ
ncbi:22567_t:CDS:1, partial [Rhizophagus irregularis]